MTAIVDTGPLVAFLDGRDPHHRWAHETFDSFRLPLVTYEAVLSEACFLVRQAKRTQNSVLGLVSRGVIVLDFRLRRRDEADDRRELDPHPVHRPGVDRSSLGSRARRTVTVSKGPGLRIRARVRGGG